jgi:hypothetical protein
MICIIGGKGNMGTRYTRICEVSGIPVHVVDVGDPVPKNNQFTHFLIATPTETHERILFQLMVANTDPINILCEKPIVKGDKIPALGFAEKRGHNLYMVNQYAYYSENITDGQGITEYNYFNSGKDSLVWDCITLIHLAKGKISLSNTSPIWRAHINGVKLDRDQIDMCYIKMIKDFHTNGETYGRLWGTEDIRQAHKKAKHATNYNWNSGPIYIK